MGAALRLQPTVAPRSVARSPRAQPPQVPEPAQMRLPWTPASRDTHDRSPGTSGPSEIDGIAGTSRDTIGITGTTGTMMTGTMSGAARGTSRRRHDTSDTGATKSGLRG